jgi:MFS family permease
MVLFHFSNAPGGVYLGLFMKQDLDTPENLLPVAFVVSMIVWMLAVGSVGKLADRIGRRPLLIAAWAIMTARLVLLALAEATWQALAIQFFVFSATRWLASFRTVATTTSAFWAMPPTATARYLHGRDPSRHPGASWTRSSETRLRPKSEEVFDDATCPGRIPTRCR